MMDELVHILSFTDDKTLLDMITYSGKLRDFIKQHKQTICKLKLGKIWEQYKHCGFTPCQLYLVKEEIKTPNKMLMKYTKSNNLTNVKIALCFGADEYKNALYEASIDGYIDIISEILSKDTQLLNYVLWISSYADQLDVIKYALDNGADIHSNNDQALIYACTFYPRVHIPGTYPVYHGTRIVEFLLQNGADIHARQDGALISACVHENTDIVEFLLQNGADVHAQNDRALRIVLNNKDKHTYRVLMPYLENESEASENDSYSEASDSEGSPISVTRRV